MIVAKGIVKGHNSVGASFLRKGMNGLTVNHCGHKITLDQN